MVTVTQLGSWRRGQEARLAARDAADASRAPSTFFFFFGFITLLIIFYGVFYLLLTTATMMIHTRRGGYGFQGYGYGYDGGYRCGHLYPYPSYPYPCTRRV